MRLSQSIVGLAVDSGGKSPPRALQTRGTGPTEDEFRRERDDDGQHRPDGLKPDE